LGEITTTSLESYQTVVNLIGGTRTKTGLKVKARLDQREYEKGVSITDEQMKTIHLAFGF